MRFLDSVNSVFHNLFEPFWAGVSKLAVAIGIVLLGQWTDALNALMILMILDLLFGLWDAAKTKTLNRRVAFTKSAAKLGVYWGLLIMSHQLAKTGWSEYPMSVTILYLAITEAISIVHHGEIITGRRLRFFEFADLFTAATGKNQAKKTVQEAAEKPIEKTESQEK